MLPLFYFIFFFTGIFFELTFCKPTVASRGIRMAPSPRDPALTAMLVIAMPHFRHSYSTETSHVGSTASPPPPPPSRASKRPSSTSTSKPSSSSPSSSSSQSQSPLLQSEDSLTKELDDAKKQAENSADQAAKNVEAVTEAIVGEDKALEPATKATTLSDVIKKEHDSTTIWQKIKAGVLHFWDGTKLLGVEIKISTKLAVKMAAGYELTRRESRQLKRTTEDLVRLVPFSMFVIVPFAELLLPIALKLFPNLLPSTYEGASEKEKRVKNLRKTRKEVSEFLRNTVKESGLRLPQTSNNAQRELFANFFRKVRSSGESPSRDELLSVCRLFKDDIVLDNLSRPQLVAMAKYMNLPTFGTDLVLRYQIRHRMRQTKRDDRAIDYEGVESLSVPELQAACQSRGITTHGVSPGRLRDDLHTWLELRLRQNVPSTLLVLSAAYTYGQNSEDSHDAALLAVLSSIPDELFHEAELEVHHAEGTATNKQRLEVVKEQEELIKDENLQVEKSGKVVKDNVSVDDDETTRTIKQSSDSTGSDNQEAIENSESKDENK
ncbi:LETM1-like protein-domain-containing protein [Lipomyces japonicus]|uniref:LETM1-like protein-domain-containing protein n=1 Tax=Lipomyces japonicus TaxID=56871 RepID=UPI0034CD75BF